MKLFLIPCAIGLSFLLSCHQKPDQSSVKIIGGEAVEDGSFANVVAITDRQGLPFGFPPLTPEQFEMFKNELKPTIKCTGTALTPTLIVTAAHCLVDLTKLPDHPVFKNVHAGVGIEGAKFDFSFNGEELPEGSNDGNLLEIEATGVHPKYVESHGMGAYDIGFIRLAKPLDLPASAYMPLLTDTSVLVPGTKVRAIGYGARGVKNTAPTGRKFGVDLTIYDALAEKDQKTENGQPLHNVWDPESEIVVKDEGKGSCRGDSGGPLFVEKDGGWQLFGIVSRAYGRDTCASYATIFGLLPKSICWVQTESKVDLQLPAGTCDSH